MAQGKARTPKSFGKRIKDQQEDIKKLYSLVEQRNTVQQITSASRGPAIAAGETPQHQFLKTAGDTMVGPIAFLPALIALTSSKTIDIGKDTDNFTSRIILSNTGAFQLETISGAEHNGQLLFLQGVQTESIVITNADNIETIDGSNFTIEDDDIIIFQFDVTDNKWQQVTTGKQNLGLALTTKGDLHGFDTADKRIPIGTNNQVLTADSAQALGLKWTNGQTPWLQDIDADGFDLKDLSNIEFRATTGAPTGSVSYINNDASGDMILNVATGDGFFMQINNNDEFDFTEVGGSNDPIIVVKGRDNQTPILRVTRLDSTPSAGASVGRHEFVGVDSGGSTEEEFGRISVDAEDLTVGSVDGSMHLGVDLNSLPVVFISLNNSNDGKITPWKNIHMAAGIDVEMVTNDIWMDETADGTRVSGTATALNMHVGGTSVVSASSSAFTLQGSTTLSIPELFSMVATSATGVSDGIMWHDSGTGDVLVRSGGAERNLSNIVSSQTPWIADIDADGFDLKDLSNIEFRSSTGIPAGSAPFIYYAGGIINNNPANEIFQWTIDNFTKMKFRRFSGLQVIDNRLQGSKGANVASASDITLTEDGNVFDITGTTTINTINHTNWQAGAIVHLHFNEILTVTHNSGGTHDILLANQANMTTSGGDVLSLYYADPDWIEISRSIVGSTTALDNLASVAINTSLISDTDDTDDLGSASKEWKDLFIDGSANIDTLTNSVAIAVTADLDFDINSTCDFNLNQTTVGSAGAASTLPSAPEGYVVIKINGTQKVMPFYAKS